MLLYYFTHEYVHYVLRFETFVATNLWYFHNIYVQFNTGRFLLRVNFKNCTLCNLITLDKMVQYVMIVIEGYF